MKLLFIFMLIFVWVLVFIFLFLYDLWSPAMAETTYNMEISINESNASSGLMSSARTSLSDVRSVWKYWPLVMLFCLVVLIIIATQKFEPMHQIYGA